jgi:hypothetical protein
MGKGSLLTLSIHVFVCGRQALAVRASGLASFLGQNAGRTSRHSQISMNRTGRSRNSAGFSPLRAPHGSRCADRFGRINRNQFSMLRRTDWLIDLSARKAQVFRPRYAVPKASNSKLNAAIQAGSTRCDIPTKMAQKHKTGHRKIMDSPAPLDG